MSQDTENFNKVINILEKQLNLSKEQKDTVTRDSELQSLGLDSLDKVELVMAMEEEFGIEIADKDAESMHTVDDILLYISNNNSK